MNRRNLLIVPLLAMTACGADGAQEHYPSSAAYVHEADAKRARAPGKDRPCQRGNERLSPHECYRMGPPKRMRGVVVSRDGGWYFYPNATAVPAAESAGRPIQLLQGARRRLDETVDTTLTHRAMWQEFIGRQTLVEDRYGRDGRFAHIVMVEKPIAARPVPMPEGQ